FGGIDNNSICIAMVAGAGVALFFGLSEKVWWRKIGALGAAALMVHTPMFSESRGGMLGIIAAGVVTFAVLPKKPAYVGVFVLAAMLARGMARPAVWERFNTTFAEKEERDESAESRLQLWADCWDVMKKNPLTG